MKPIITKYKYFSLAIITSIVALVIWYYVLDIAPKTAYLPLSVIIRFEGIAPWIMGSMNGLRLLSVGFFIVSMVRKELSIWIVISAVLLLIFSNSYMMFSFMQL